MKQKKTDALSDLKEVDLDSLGNLINEYGDNKQIIFTHYKEETVDKCMKQLTIFELCCG